MVSDLIDYLGECDVVTHINVDQSYENKPEV